MYCRRPLTLRHRTPTGTLTLALHGSSSNGSDVKQPAVPSSSALSGAASATEHSERRDTLHADSGFHHQQASRQNQLLDAALGARGAARHRDLPPDLHHLLLGKTEELTAASGLSDSAVDLDVAITRSATQAGASRP